MDDDPGGRHDRDARDDGVGGRSGGGCPFHGSDGGDGSDDRHRGAALAERAVDRRSFLRTALAIGGTSALAAVSGCSGDATDDRLGSLDVPRGPTDPAAFPDRQHAWNRDLKTDPFGNPVLPTHQLILFLDYPGVGPPTDDERREVEAAFRTLELAFQRLAGGDHDADNEGLVAMVGYSGAYFDRFGEDLPGSVGLQSPAAVLEATGDDPDKADPFDAVVLLSSDTAAALLAAEEALFGRLGWLNGVRVRDTLSGVFEVADRRTAFTGKGLPRERLGDGDIHEDAPLSMGYKSGFGDNLATEDAVTIDEGPFEGGTTLQVSKLRLDLGAWYERDRGTRDELMFSRDHSPTDVGEIGEELADDSGVTEDVVEDLEATARERGRVGHAAKTARARDDDFEPLILRRSEGVNDAFHEDGKVDFNFSAVMETVEDFVETRRAMNSSDLDEYVDDGGHGILPFMEVTNRATFLVPPRRLRSLPAPRPGGA
jgi:hypothetical protein